jgi:hypothetical protein
MVITSAGIVTAAIGAGLVLWIAYLRGVIRIYEDLFVEHYEECKSFRDKVKV